MVLKLATTERLITELLTSLETLLKQIEPMRKRAEEIATGLAQTQREYELKMSAANAEAERLEALKRSLARSPQPVDPPPPIPPPPAPVPPPPIDVVDPGVIRPPEPPRENPRTARKRTLLDHIFYFSDAGQNTVIEQINSLLDDEQRDVGDILEMLAWGDIWRARADWETLEQQRQRLYGWHDALKQRLTYWEQEINSLERDDFYELWERRSELTEPQWQSFLDQLLQEQEAENQRLAREVAAIESGAQAEQTVTKADHV
jgi:hypothetical protein